MGTIEIGKELGAKWAPETELVVSAPKCRRGLYLLN
jgi:hypothetical protein